MKQIGKLNLARALRWLGCAALVAAAIVFASLPSAEVSAQQDKDKKQAQQKQDPKKQDPQKKPDDVETIRIGTQLVNVLFSVQDKQNRYVNDIKQEEIEILENGQAQPIFSFKKEFDLPLTMAILVDVSGSEQYTLPILKDSGGQFIDSVIRVGHDTAAVIKFDGEPVIMQDLTSNPARVRRGLDQIEFIAAPPSGIYGGATPPINGGSRQGGTSIYDSVFATCADMLARKPGRKTILLLTDGVDTTSRIKIGDAIEEALKSEVVIYAIGIGDTGHFDVNEGVLKKLSESTGGRAFIPKGHRDLADAFVQLERDMRQQYLLAYEPKNDTLDGTFRKLEIRLANRNAKDLKIRHRKGYYAPKG
ncbi:MAG: VWA domain-containing protein [Acidobacteriota bacterium]